MKGRTPPSLNGSLQRRRSPRLTSPLVNADNNMAPANSIAVKRSIVVRKIAPRKTTAQPEQDKENTPRRPKVSTPGLVPDCGRSSGAKKLTAMPSPILPPSSPKEPTADPQDAVWSQKVRRSYTRLSEKSFNSPEARETLFGFEKLQTPEVGRSVGRTTTGPDVSSCSFTSMLDADYCGPAFSEPDANIPGVAVVKEKRNRRKIQQIDVTELDALAAKMNAEFEEAEEFELVVE
ncbi:sororin [Dunckerocampus dactyliophorus]|uniref:sororin n=1 Tax=Dunckerocampus dactyliophorus TaxID=161453 RepID=UPI002405D98B|nr:sororin [Dunckerocampus dactyliophorus]